MPETETETSSTVAIATITKEPRTGSSEPKENPLLKNGRKLCLQTMDAFLSEPDNQACLREAMEREFQDGPMNFFHDYVMPNLPKQTLIEANIDHKASLSIILTQEIADEDDIGQIEHKHNPNPIIDSIGSKPVREAQPVLASHSTHDEPLNQDGDEVKNL